MTKIRIGLLLVVIFFTCLSYGQTTITGQITDASDSTAVSFASVVIYQYQSNKILNYTQTDIEGFYHLEINSKPQVITLKTSHLSYHPYRQDIVIGSDQSEQIILNFGLSPKAEKLQEVIIKGPIIVKEDTIIYDVEHWTEARDQTLEEVLAKIPGFKIKAGGEIEVNGKKIDKVLIDGEEVTNSGARLLTRSIAPEDVESVEVRLDEKNDKLKESLLDAERYVVLDIKLKEELNKSLFGKIRGTLGYQRKLEAGGYLNAFSLKKKLKTHLFAEHDRFGEQTISLDQIKNIGVEALQKLFNTPADFRTLTQRQAFQDEIYGFKNYTIAHKDIVGLTSRYTISPFVDLYFGTYNAYAKNEKSRQYTQAFNEGNRTYQFAESEQVTDYSSKNKLEIRLDKGKVKARLDVNAVIFNNDNQNPVNESSQSIQYRYQDKHKSQSYYQNLFIEYAPTKKFGLRSVASYSSIHSDHVKNLTHNNQLYRSVLFDEHNNPVIHLRQNTLSRTNNFISEIMGQYQSPVGQVNFGVRFENRMLKGEKKGYNLNEIKNITSVSRFTGTENIFDFRKWGPFVEYRTSVGSFTFQNAAAFVYATYPNADNNQKNLQFFEFKTEIEFSTGFNSISASLSRRMSSFPMQKLIQGHDLTSFQMIVIPNQKMLKPTPEYTLEVFETYKFDDIDLLFDAAAAYGRVQNADRFLFDMTPIITTTYDQLSSEYLLLTFPLTKTFKKIPLDIILEPEWIGSQNQNIDPAGDFYLTKTSSTLLGIKFNTLFRDKPYDFHLYPKYSGFLFENELYRSAQRLEMFSVNFSLKLDFFDKKLLLTPTLRAVTFLGNVNSDFTNISLKIESPSAKFRWFIVADNLLNNTSFTTQTIFPTYFNSESNSVFERYVRFGIEFKFK